MAVEPRTLALRKSLGRAIRRGHPWIYRDALRAPPELPDGTVVRVDASDGRPLAWGYYDARSPIAVRVLAPTRARAAPDLEAMVAERFRAALARRLAAVDRATTNAFRWVHGEADGLPGLHVDLYDDVAAVRADGAGARAFYRDLPRRLRAAAPFPLTAVVERAPRGGRREAGGDAPPRGEKVVLENRLRFAVDLAHGQKGGLFLDQRENRAFVGARAAGKSLLNLFGYTGGFSVYAAAAGARSTDTVDRARPAIAAARRNFALNGLATEAAGFHAEDAFAFLARAATAGRHWDLVVSDPPSFAPSRRALPAGLRAYTRLHAACARVVAPGGALFAASCSSHVALPAFIESVQAGARAAGRRAAIETVRGAGFDHPVMAAFPEGDYLKLAVARIE